MARPSPSFCSAGGRLQPVPSKGGCLAADQARPSLHHPLSPLPCPAAVWHRHHRASCLPAAARTPAPRALATAAAAAPSELIITRPDDWHLHVRDGAGLRSVVPHTAAHFGRAVIMPNLVPPVTTAAQVRARTGARMPGLHRLPCPPCPCAGCVAALVRARAIPTSWHTAHSPVAER